MRETEGLLRVAVEAVVVGVSLEVVRLVDDVVVLVELDVELAVVNRPATNVVVEEAPPSCRLYELTAAEPEPCQTSVPRSMLAMDVGVRPRL